MCRTGDVTARPVPKEGRTRRTALQFSSLAILIVEESTGKISTTDALYTLAYVITRLSPLISARKFRPILLMNVQSYLALRTIIQHRPSVLLMF